jgi:hypothetical protein
MNCSIDYMNQALKITDDIAKQYKEDVAISKKQQNKVKGVVEKMIKDQEDILEASIKYIILCGAQELEFTRQLGGF